MDLSFSSISVVRYVSAKLVLETLPSRQIGGEASCYQRWLQCVHRTSAPSPSEISASIHEIVAAHDVPVSSACQLLHDTSGELEIPLRITVLQF